jgi:hypothetical protein
LAFFPLPVSPLSTTPYPKVASIRPIKTTRYQKALLGNSEIIQEGMRTHFGYLGDIGNLPSKTESLSALLANPGVPPWNMDTTARLLMAGMAPI